MEEPSKTELKAKAITRYREAVRKAFDCNLPKLPKEFSDEVTLRYKVCERLGATKIELEKAFSDEWNENEERKECNTQSLC